MVRHYVYARSENVPRSPEGAGREGRITTSDQSHRRGEVAVSEHGRKRRRPCVARPTGWPRREAAA